MARSMSSGRKVGRPALGNNSSKPLNRPRPAYKPSAAPKPVGSGSVSHPTDTRWAKGTLKTQVQDAPPKVVTL